MKFKFRLAFVVLLTGLFTVIGMASGVSLDSTILSKHCQELAKEKQTLEIASSDCCCGTHANTIEDNCSCITPSNGKNKTSIILSFSPNFEYSDVFEESLGPVLNGVEIRLNPELYSHECRGPPDWQIVQSRTYRGPPCSN